MQWPYKRFEGIYAAMVKRQSVSSIEAQKHQMISALYANSAFDESQEGLEERKKRIEDIERHFNKAIEIVYNPELHEQDEIDWNNPFWAAAQRAHQRNLERVRGQGTVAQVTGLDGSEFADPVKRQKQFDQIG